LRFSILSVKIYKTLYSLGDRWQCLGGTGCLHLQSMLMEIIGSFIMLVPATELYSKDQIMDSPSSQLSLTIT